MIIYVNGDSHSTGAQAVNNHCFALDDPEFVYYGRAPHPHNLKVSYGNLIAEHFSADLICAAESGGSNDRVFRTTKEYLQTNTPDLIIIGWSTWEREEWLHNDVYWQVSAGGIGEDWPKPFQQAYKPWLANVDYIEKELKTHEKIWDLHCELLQKEIPHLFFNTYLCFAHIRQNNLPRYDWGNNYIDPYSEESTYYYWLKNQGFKTISPNNYHYPADAHRAWADHLIPVVDKLIKR